MNYQFLFLLAENYSSILRSVYLVVAVGYPYGGFMYTFVGKTVPFLIIGALTLVDLGKTPVNPLSCTFA